VSDTLNITVAKLVKTHLTYLGVFKKIGIGISTPNETNPALLPFAMIVFQDMNFTDQTTDFIVSIWVYFYGAKPIDTDGELPLAELYTTMQKVRQELLNRRCEYEDLLCSLDFNMTARQEYTLQRFGREDVTINPPYFAFSLDVPVKFNGYNI